MKKLIPLLVLLSAVLLSGCQKKAGNSDSSGSQELAGARLVINQLDQDKRPFVILSQHPTGRLLALFLENTSQIKAATADLEYLSGDLLKGARSTLESPISDPYAKAFLLGSCSAGGKCSFDKNLTSGSLKLKLKVQGESDTHVLKGDYFFIDGPTNTADGRITYTPIGNPRGETLLNSLGLPKKLEGKLELYPIAITSSSKQIIRGELEIRKKGVGKVVLYDGSDYQDLDAKIDSDKVIIDLNHAPRKELVKIIRDDLKGAEESQTFYVLGPIVLLGQ